MKKPIILLTLATIVLFICLLFLPELSVAQPTPPGAPAPTPIDGGLVLLAAAGGGYAIKKIRDRKT